MAKQSRTAQGEDFVHGDLDRLRHSASHVLAQAVKRLFPEAKLAIGPAIKDGFYYDFDLGRTFTEDDLERLEQVMKEIVQNAYPFIREEMDRLEALQFFRKRGEDYKCEIIEAIRDEKVSIYKDGEFVDLCRGPHVENTGEVKALKLLSVAGAYWRGSEQNQMLQRIYGTAFFSQKELDEHVRNLEEAKRRDHRKLGRELDLFSFHEEAPGSVFFHPKGFFLYNALIEFIRGKLAGRGYLEVQAPMVLAKELWEKSGHYENFREAMYFTKQEEREFAIKPMNCPGHVLIYQTAQHSYRELPLRIAEFGRVHRFEKSGVTHGLLRVRSFIQDDAHHFCAPEQLEEEIRGLIELTKDVYRAFGFHEFQVAVSTRPPKAMGSPEAWEQATQALKAALENLGMPYEVHEGEGAFYGPKIEFVVFDSLNRPWQCGTIQVDFSMPERFDLEYIGADGGRHRPVMVHRAILGSIERFLGILIEHYGGAFPLWLAPEQVRVATISDKCESFGEEVRRMLVDAGIRAEFDRRPEKIGYKVREAEAQKIPYVAVVGEREADSRTVSVRARGRRDLGSFALPVFVDKLQEEINGRR
jgi:threonyl-tRNA synthetase